MKDYGKRLDVIIKGVFQVFHIRIGNTFMNWMDNFRKRVFQPYICHTS